MAFSAALAFQFLQGLDETGILGNSALVDVIDTKGEASGAQAVDAVRSFSAQRGVGVAREVPDLRNPDRVRHLYLAPGRPGSLTAGWLDDGYPAFSRNHQTRVHPLADVRHLDPRGSYYVFGPPTAADHLVAELRGLGLTARVTHPLSYAEVVDRYSDDPLFRALWVVALAALAMTGANVLLNAKSYGVLRLQGLSLREMLLRDLRRMAVFWLGAAGTVTAVAIVSLGLYNGLAWLGLFAIVATTSAVLLTALVIATHAAVLALAMKVDILPALKGGLPSRAASVSVYLVRIPALLLALGIATDVSVTTRDVLVRMENRAAYDTVGDAVSIRLSGAFAMHTDQLDAHVGPWLRAADKRGEIVLAGRRDLQMSAPGEHLPPSDILIVNDTYLQKQSVLSPTGQRYTAAPRGGGSEREARVIIPESLASHTPVIEKAASEIIGPRGGQDVSIETLASRTGQRLFGYNTGAYAYSSAHGPDEDRSVLSDPILIAVPNGSPLLSDDAYTTYATQAGVIFLDPDDVVTGIETNGLQDYISAMSPVGQKTAVDFRNVVHELRMQMFNLVVSVIVLLFAGIGVCIIYSRKNAQAIFVRHISGWRYVATHRFVLAVEAAIAVIFATRVPLEAWQERQALKEFAASGTPAPYQPTHLTLLDVGVITGLVALEFGAVLLALAYFHRRIVKEGATAG